MDPHWAIQWFHTAQGRIRYDQIGRFEDFLADFQTSAATRRHKISQYYTPEITDIVCDVYHDDFEGFGYPYTIPASSP